MLLNFIRLNNLSKYLNYDEALNVLYNVAHVSYNIIEVASYDSRIEHSEIYKRLHNLIIKNYSGYAEPTSKDIDDIYEIAIEKPFIYNIKITTTHDSIIRKLKIKKFIFEWFSVLGVITMDYKVLLDQTNEKYRVDEFKKYIFDCCRNIVKARYYKGEQ